MEFITATATSDEKGPLTRRVDAYCEALGEIVASGASKEEDWDPLTEYIDAAKFKRVGAYLEELDWAAYRRFMTNWVAGGTKFEMTVFRITEAGRIVVQEIEERHYRGDEFIRKNVIALYVFDDAQKIVHLDIYEQAKDTGRWIAEAAEAATA